MMFFMTHRQSIEPPLQYSFPDELPETMQKSEDYHKKIIENGKFEDLSSQTIQEHARELGLLAGATFILTDPETQGTEAVQAFSKKYFTEEDSERARSHNMLNPRARDLSPQYIARVAASIALMSLRNEDMYIKSIMEAGKVDRGGVTKVVHAFQAHGYADTVRSLSSGNRHLIVPRSKMAMTLLRNPRWKHEIRIQDEMRRSGLDREAATYGLVALGYTRKLNTGEVAGWNDEDLA